MTRCKVANRRRHDNFKALRSDGEISIEVLGAPAEHLCMAPHVVDELLVDEGLGVRQKIHIEYCRVRRQRPEVDLLRVMCYMAHSSWRGF